MAEERRNEEARREVLAAVRRHLAASAPHDAVRKEHHAHEDGAAKGKGRVIEAAREEEATPVERFRRALEAVAGRCFVVRDVSDASEVLQGILVEKNARRVAVSDSELVGRVLAQTNLEGELVERASAAELFGCDVGVTGAQYAVAETGTLVLEAEGERHRLASLVPPVHVALVGAGQVRETLGEVLQSLSKGGRERLSRTVTFVTGPSRTSDIELTLAIGVHGPGELYVIIIEEEGHE